MNRQGQVLQLGLERNKARRRIQEYLDARGMNFARLAKYAGVTGPAVYRTVSGQIHSPRVLQALREMGVPEQYLFDPRRIGEEEARNVPREALIYSPHRYRQS